MNNTPREPIAGDTQSAPTAVPLVAARGVCKSYTMGKRSLEVLSGVDLTVERGSFVVVRGASGSGKSTLLHLLGALDQPCRGEIWFESEDLAKLSVSELSRFRNRKIGFVFQAYHLLPELSALENICLPARMARRPVAEVEHRASELLEQVGLKARADHRPYELSGGEQQRVAIARALINDPELLIADEPTGNLDSKTGGEILDLLCRIRAECQTTLIIATHDAHVAEQSPQGVELLDGRILSA